MKKKWIILLITAVLLLIGFVFRDPIIDFLPIDQSHWVEQDGKYYLLDEKGDPRIGWHSNAKGCYYFRQDGVMHTGWLEENGNRYFFDADGKLHTGWLEEDGIRHYFHNNGLLASGLLERNGRRFYLDENGTPVTGWQQVGERNCYVSAGGNIRSGWLELDGKKYYLNERGFCHTGWLDSSHGRYYFTEEGTMATGWLKVGGSTYYMGNDGIMATGWLSRNGRTYYMKSDGSMATGWTEISGKPHYFDQSGCPHRGWLEQGGKRYYIGNNGIMHTGWLEVDGSRYYLKSDGTPAVGKLEIDGKNYFFSSTGVNFILVNAWNYLPEDFTVELVEFSDVLLDPACLEDLEHMLKDCRAAGYRPRIMSGYRSIETQRRNFNRMLYSVGGNPAAARRIVAEPGTSEHHLGLAFDIVDANDPTLTQNQRNMPAQKWLMANSWKYGFILRYPKEATGITGIIYEPWHYRYVGKEIAAELYALGVCLEVYIDNLTGDGSTCGAPQESP